MIFHWFLGLGRPFWEPKSIKHQWRNGAKGEMRFDVDFSPIFDHFRRHFGSQKARKVYWKTHRKTDLEKISPKLPQGLKKRPRRSSAPPFLTPGEGVGGGVNPSPKGLGKEGLMNQGFDEPRVSPKPPSPKGLVGLPLKFSCYIST